MKKKESAKRIVALLLALIMAVLCCACSGGENTTTDSGESRNTQAQRPDGSSTNAQHPDTESPEKTVKLEKCESTGEVGFDKIDMGNDYLVYFTGSEASVFPFKYDGKYGYINEKGEIVIRDQYDKAGSFSEGKAFVHNSDGWHIIDTDNSVLFSSKYNLLSGYWLSSTLPVFQNGYATSVYLYNSDESWQFCIIDNKFNIKKYNMEDFENVLWNLTPDVINTDLFIGYMIKNAALTDTYLTCRFYNINDDLMSEFSTLDINAIRIIGGKYSYLKNNERKYSIVDITTGASVTDYIFDEVGSYSDGVIPVSAYDKWGLIDTEGNELIKPKYAYLSKFSHGLGFALDFDGNGLLINKSGETVAYLPPKIFGGDDSIDVETFTDSGFIYQMTMTKVFSSMKKVK